ncbi:LysM peptidoglycan-binding domain-containing protein [Chloroflexi bacterium TSY]|nr:LysM peptidoglycan-binding domain-containing protein [Chloroflexi bacterium TSY]
MGAAYDLFAWIAGAFYVLVSLAIVYLYFFKIVPPVLAKVGSWNLWSVIQVTLVLGLIAIILGSVAVFTADWIFGSVLDTLPRTRMARELNRVTGSMMHLSIESPGIDTTGYFFSGERGSDSDNSDSNLDVGVRQQPGNSLVTREDGVQLRLKPNALELWASRVQSVYNESGRISDNRKVMSKRDVPEGVMCDVAAVADGYYPKRYEDWNLTCSDDSFRSSLTLVVNGTAARGLTGGSYYSIENPFTLYGTGRWPDVAYETILSPDQGSDENDPETPSGDSQPTPTASPNDSGATSDEVAEPAGGPSIGEAQVHEVQKGESLAMIAARYGVPMRKLVQANAAKYPRLQNDPNVIGIGWTLVVPEQ